MDHLNQKRRSDNMRQIRAKNTEPELLIRRLVTQLGYRYRLHVKSLPGSPDLVFRRLKRVIFVHGCFWHQHQDCREGRMPGTRTEYWEPKLLRNIERDRLHRDALVKSGWRVLIIWECELHRSDLTERIAAFLTPCA
jgi:DNA mismatch endonuclease (patch repair protein)